MPSPNRAWRITILLILLLANTACETIVSQFRSPSERLRLEADRLLSEGRKEEAILSYRAAVESDPSNLLAVKSLSGVYSAQGRRRLALRLLRSASQRASQDRDLSQMITQTEASMPTSGLLALAWQAELGVEDPVGFNLDSERIYVSSSTSLAALDARNGSALWKIALPSPATSAPVTINGRLFVGMQDGMLIALVSSDGSQLWSYATKAPIYAPPSGGEQWLYLASGDGTLYALNPVSGALGWSFATSGAIHARPTVANGVVFFGSYDGHLYALDAITGNPIWQYGILTQGPVESQALVKNGRVYFGSGDSRVYSLAEASGGEYWRFSTADAVYALPLLGENRLFVVSAGNTLTALDPLSGKKLWEIDTGSAMRDPPALAGGRLFYTAAANPNLYAADPTNGAVLLQLDSGDWFSAGPLVDSSLLYLLGKDGTLLAYRLN